MIDDVSTPLVTVLTPFYNTRKYLAEAIESVLAQSYTNYEYILVDNCSDDGSTDIAKHYASSDERIRLHTNDTFLSQVANYNHALTLLAPEAKYAKIVQADDLIFPRCVENMVATMEGHPSVGIVGSYHLLGRALEGAGLPYDKVFVEGHEACRRHLLGEYFLFGSPTTVMYRASIVRARSPFYTEGHLHEDTEAAYEILDKHDFGFVHQVLSFIRTQEESIMGQVRDQQPQVLDLFLSFSLYGRKYLSRDEYAHRAAIVEKYYYLTLAKAWLQRNSSDFFEYHQKGLASIGTQIDYPRLYRYAARVVLTQLLRPADTVASLLRHTDRNG